MATLLRNPAFFRQTVTLLAASAVVAAASWAIAGSPAGGAGGDAAGAAACASALVAGTVCTALFCIFSHRRYAEISRLSSEIDAVLHGGRELTISDYREGDVAVLRNEVGKVCARLSKTAEDLRDEKRALADALADISHQIRTPLTAVELLVPVIERSRDARERAAKLRDLESLVDRVSWLVTSLLKIASIDAGAVAMSSSRHAVDSTVDAALRPLEVALDMRGIACIRDIAPEASYLGDAAWTTEALSNILKNCMEHTPAGGAIRISASEDAVACRIRIQDSGCGIAQDDLPHIFERFYRGRAPHAARLAPSDDGPASRATKNPSPEGMRPAGFGIGLSLAQTLVNAQGGSIRASNADEGGARFDIAFPKMTV